MTSRTGATTPPPSARWNVSCRWGQLVINENDAVATNEIRFGDNDRFAALVWLIRSVPMRFRSCPVTSTVCTTETRKRRPQWGAGAVHR